MKSLVIALFLLPAKALLPADEAANLSPSAAVDVSVTAEVTSQAAPLEAEAYRVLGKRASQVGSRMALPAKDLPATINVITQEELRKRGATEWVGALRYTNGIMPLFTYGGFNSATVRGMQENDLMVLLDGVRDDIYNQVWSTPQSNLAGVESVEVLKGPSSMLYGVGALAGAIQKTRKKPSAGQQWELALGKGSFGAQKVELGLGGTIAELPLRYRLDFSHTGEKGYRSAPQRRNTGTLALEWVPLGNLSFLYRGQVARDRYDNPDPGMPIDLDNMRVPSDAPLNRNYGNPSDFLDYAAHSHHLEAKWEGEGFALVNRSAVSPADYEYLEAEALDLGADNRTITRDYLYFYHHLRSVLNQTELSWNKEGDFGQQGLLGFDIHRFDFSSERDSMLNYSGYAIPTIDLYDPAPGKTIVTPMPDGRRLAGVNSMAVYAQNLSKFGDYLKVLASARYDSYERRQSSDTLNPLTQDILDVGYVTKSAKSYLTWRGGLIYSLTSWLNAYGSYSTAFKPVLVTDSSDGKVDWEPETGRQVELGLKWEAGDGAIEGSLAWFDIVKSNVLIRRNNAPRVYSQDGEKYSTGIELESKFRAGKDFSLMAGYSYVDARMTRFSIGTGSFIGGRPYAVPLHSASARAEIGLTRKLSLGLGGRFVGDQYADDVDNLVRMPFYALADASLHYRRGPWSADLVASNVLDERRYFTSTIFGNNPQLYPGEPLKLDLTLRYAL